MSPKLGGVVDRQGSTYWSSMNRSLDYAEMARLVLRCVSMQTRHSYFMRVHFPVRMPRRSRQGSVIGLSVNSRPETVHW